MMHDYNNVDRNYINDDDGDDKNDNDDKRESS